MKNYFLYPGQFMVVREPSILSTMLGSCVGVALWDRRTHVGGLNHFLLHDAIEGESGSPRYGRPAMRMLIDECLKAGAAKSDLVARVYGGAAVLGQVSIGQKIGEKNISVALEVLRAEGIRVAGQSTGGEQGRKISFNTQSGEVSESFSRGQVDVSGFGPLPETSALGGEVKVLIVDDSVTVRTLFQRIFTRAGLKVVGCAADPFEAREAIMREKPDVITLDIEMPHMNGVRFLEKLMKHMPIPTVMVSSLSSQGEAALESLRLGAVEFMQKPSQADPELLRQFGEVLITKVRAAATSRLLVSRPAANIQATAESLPRARGGFTGQVSGIFVGGNTGAPKSVVKMLSTFTGDTPPVVMAVSTLAPILPAFIKDLKKQVKIDLRQPTESTLLARGSVYFIGENQHGRVRQGAGQPMLEISTGAPVNGQQPSSDILLESAAQALGPTAVGILLSGFGSDGVKGLTRIHDAGGYTLVEAPNEASFPFIPQAAIASGAASDVVSAAEIFTALMSYRDRRTA